MNIVNRMKIELKKYGPVLGGRKIAIEIRNQVLKEGKVSLDFDGIHTVSRIFAEELLGKLAQLKGREVYLNQVQILNISDENRKMLIYVIKGY